MSQPGKLAPDANRTDPLPTEAARLFFISLGRWPVKWAAGEPGMSFAKGLSFKVWVLDIIGIIGYNGYIELSKLVNRSATMETTIFKAFNQMTRKFEEVTAESELLPGQTVIRMFWCQSADRFVTVPGESEFKVNQSFELVKVQG